MYELLRAIIQKQGENANLDLREEYLGTTAKEQKPALHIYGSRTVSIAGRKPQPTYVAGIVRQKAYAGFYHMPVYSHPEEFKLSDELEKARKGKSCFHIKTSDPALVAEIEELLIIGIELYRRLDWI